MLRDALACESFKFWRNRPVLFWGYLFAPLVALAIGLGTEFFFRANLGLAVAQPPTDLAQRAMNSIAQAASPLTELFCLIGAASLFGSEYRWETWRLATPRNSRLALLSAKVLIYAGACAVTILAIGLAGAISGLAGAVLHGTPLVWRSPSAPAYLIAVLGVSLTSWLQLLQVGALAAAVAVATRSTLPAVIVPIVLGVGQSILQGQLGGRAETPRLQDLVTLPELAAEHLRAFAAGPILQGGSQVSNVTAGMALGALALWIAAGFTTAIAVFQRQDLARE